jgi:hypothetical protein
MRREPALGAPSAIPNRVEQLSAKRQTGRATFQAMHSALFFFGYFWFSHRMAAGEANV